MFATVVRCASRSLLTGGGGGSSSSSGGGGGIMVTHSEME
jgi:uncharacterized membrane protein